MNRIVNCQISRFLTAAALFLLTTVVQAPAQERGVLTVGDAVVTGFSGVIEPKPQVPSFTPEQILDETFIDPDGISARINSLAAPGYVWDARVWPAHMVRGFKARDIGQVFGVTLDDAEHPSIYLAASSVYGLHLVAPDADGDGHPERVKAGQKGLAWMDGMWGEADTKGAAGSAGGPGSIWKVDGISGEITLFANVEYQSSENKGPGLGNITYVPGLKQIFVSDLSTGMIHRFAMDGTEIEIFDHGVTGREAVKLPPVPYDAKNGLDVSSRDFDPQDQETWGYAAPDRRVWGLAFHDGRLFYSVVGGSQIWSVGFDSQSGKFADPRWELDVPQKPKNLPVTDIVFTSKGMMVLAQRGSVKSTYDYSNFAEYGKSRVYRYRLETPEDETTPSRWVAEPEEYAVGFEGEQRSTDGGLDLNYGYSKQGLLDTEACEASLWTTADNLRNNRELAATLLPGGALVIDGLQGMPAGPVKQYKTNNNSPPWASYMLDNDPANTYPSDAPRADQGSEPIRYSDDAVTGWMGDVASYRIGCDGTADGGHYCGAGYDWPSPPVYVTDSSAVGDGSSPAYPPYVSCVPGISCPIGEEQPGIDLAIKKTGKATPGTAAGAYSFSLAISNEGSAYNAAAGTLTVTDIVPTGMRFDTITGSAGWSCLPATAAAAGTPVTCTYAGGPLPAGPGAPVGTISITATALGSAPYPAFENCAEVGARPSGNRKETETANNKSCVTVKEPVAPNIQVTKVCDPAVALGSTNDWGGTPNPTMQATCRITVQASGDLPPIIELHENLASPAPAAVSPMQINITNMTSAENWQFPSFPVPQGTSGGGAGAPALATISSADLLAAGGLSTINVTVQFMNSGWVSESQNCVQAFGVETAGASGNAGAQSSKVCVPLTTTPPTGADLSTSKDWKQGETPFAGKFTVKVKNDGAAAIGSPNQIRFVDDVPAGMTITGIDPASAAQWSCATLPQTGPGPVTCAYTGTMPVAPGATLADVILDATLAPAVPPKTEPLIYSNCATSSVSGQNGQPLTDATPANNKDCAQTATVTANCLMTGTCPAGPPLSCQADVLMVVDRSASINNEYAVQAAINNFIAPMKNHGGHVEVLYFASKNNPAATPTVNVLPRTLLGAPAIPPLSLAAAGYTDWDDALKTTSGLATTPKTVVFVTDGEPTAYIDDITSAEVGGAPSLLAANEAAPWINAIRMGGSRLMAVGFGPVASQGYLEATFGGTVGGDINADIIKVSDEYALQGLMTDLGRQLCGTLNLGKISLNRIDDVIPKDQPTKVVTGPLNFQLDLKNNSQAPITAITVQDQFAPAIQPGMPADATFSPPSVVGTPTHGTATVSGTTLTWTGINLNPGETATMGFVSTYSGTHADAVYSRWNIPNFAQVTAATGDSQSTAGNMASPINGPVAEADEATAIIPITVRREQEPAQPPCTLPDAQRPASCYFAAEKQRTVSEGTCDAGQNCAYRFAVLIKPQYLPASATIKITDVLTENGTPVTTWPATITMTPAGICTTAPTSLGFTCNVARPASDTLVVFDANVVIPATTSGVIRNCIKAEITGAGAPFDGVLAPGGDVATDINQPWTTNLCAEHTVGVAGKLQPPAPPLPPVTPPAAPKCDGVTARAKGDECACLYRKMSPASATSCQCEKGSKFVKGKGCVEAQPSCKAGTRYNPERARCEPVCKQGFKYDRKRNACIQQRPECKQGTVYNAKRNRCEPVQPVCRKPFVYDAKRNACVEREQICKRGEIRVQGRCVAASACPRGQIAIPGTRICISIGGGIGLPNGHGPRPRRHENGQPQNGQQGCVPTPERGCK